MRICACGVCGEVSWRKKIRRGDLTRGSINETDVESESFDCVAITGAAISASSIGEARNLVHKPAPAETTIISKL